MELTKEEIDVIICMLDDVEATWGGLKPEERELYDKLTRGDENEE